MRFANLILIFLLSIPSGMFLLLSGSTLSFWLNDNQFSKIDIGLFSLANILHIFKFIWGPYLESFSFIKQHKYGFKISLITCLIGGIICIYGMSQISPKADIRLLSTLLILLSLFSSIYEMLLQASQIVLIDKQTWGFSEAFCVTGFRIGILISGSISIYLSTIIPWSLIYQIMGHICALILLILAFYPLQITHIPREDSSSFITAFKAFLSKQNVKFIILFLLTFRLQDNILGKMPNLYLLEVGFSKASIALVYKAGGLLATILGGFLGGLLCRKLLYRNIFILVVIMHSASCLLFLLFMNLGTQLNILYYVVLIHEFTKGLSITPFFSYQLRCCSKNYPITHIALITSITECSRIILGSFSGIIAHYFGWKLLFISASLSFVICLPIIKRLPEYNRDHTRAIHSK